MSFLGLHSGVWVRALYRSMVDSGIIIYRYTLVWMGEALGSSLLPTPAYHVCVRVFDKYVYIYICE